MSGLKRFEIDVFSLNNKSHYFNFEIDGSFFDLFDQNLLKKGTLSVSLHLDKNDQMVNVTFYIKGTIELECDRSLKKFNFPVDFEKEILYKFGDSYEEISDDLYFISRDEALNFAKDIFELIALQIPMKKIHPDQLMEGEEETEEGMMIYSSDHKNKGNKEEENKDNDDEEDNIDPRWEALKHLKKRMN